jgi:hypothetical protein
MSAPRHNRLVRRAEGRDAVVLRQGMFTGGPLTEAAR